MAKGYPEPRERDPSLDLVVLEDIIGGNTCIICKKRESDSHGMCMTCYEALHPGEA